MESSELFISFSYYQYYEKNFSNHLGVQKPKSKIFFKFSFVSFFKISSEIKILATNTKKLRKLIVFRREQANKKNFPLIRTRVISVATQSPVF